MESKGLISPEEWRRFCADTVVLGEFERFIFRSGDEIHFGMQISAADPCRCDETVRCALLSEDRTLREISVKPGVRRGRLTERADVSFGTVTAEKMKEYRVRLTLEDGLFNEYSLWVVPQYDVRITREGIVSGKRKVRFARSADEAAACGVPALVVPPAEGRLQAEYCTDFWCYPMFRSISESMRKPLPTGTMGLCIEADHPALAGFASDTFTTPVWYRILAHAHCEVIGPGAEPVVQMIDNTERCQRLGILYSLQGVHCLTARLWEDPEAPEVKAFAASLLAWLCPETD